MSQLPGPMQPQNLVVTVNGQSSVTLSWTKITSTVVVGYNVRRDGKVLNSLPITVPTYTDSTVTADHHYNYEVTSVDAGGNESAATPIQRAEVLTASTLGFIISWVEQPGMAGRPDTQWIWH
jgi:fibronectin type 3 domain-containing protein